jgi:hypothetical protein
MNGMSCTQKRTKGGAVKFLSIAILLLMSIGNAFGQVSAYTFGSASGTWTPVGAGGTRNTTLEGDDASSALTIPFTFNFNGTN